MWLRVKSYYRNNTPKSDVSPSCVELFILDNVQFAVIKTIKQLHTKHGKPITELAEYAISVNKFSYAEKTEVNRNENSVRFRFMSP
jgi:hypothetical protein